MLIQKKIHMKTCFFMHAQIHNGQNDFHQILPIHSLGRHDDIFETPFKLVLELGVLGGRGCKIWPFPLTSNTCIALLRMHVILLVL